MIKEIIIVEGKDDITRVKEAVDADVIATGGIHINKNKLNEIVELTRNRGAIILTDPDHAGGIIREKLRAALKCEIKDAYIDRASGTKKGDVGIENASVDIIKEAILKAHPNSLEPSEDFNNAFIFKYGLSGAADSANKRAYLSDRLHLGHPNAKELLKRLNNFNINRTDVIKILQEYEDNLND